MPLASLPNIIRTGAQRSAAQIQANFEALRDALNSLTDDNVAGVGFSSAAFSDALAVLLGLNKSTTVRRGKTVIATEESRTNTAYGLMPTPDRVSGVTLATDGLLYIAFQGLWKESVSDAARVAIFLGSNQLKVQSINNTTPQVQEAACAGGVNVYVPLATASFGLNGTTGSTVAGSGSDASTGQVIAYNADAAGGFAIVKAAAGSYDVSLQFKSTSGSVTVKERSLWVKAEGY